MIHVKKLPNRKYDVTLYQHNVDFVREVKAKMGKVPAMRVLRALTAEAQHPGSVIGFREARDFVEGLE